MSNGNSSDPADPKPPLALIAGPTASGKSDLAVQLALKLEAQGRPAVVINADSAQVYADLAIVSARPSEEEMRGIDHRLFGAWDGAVACSAADWAQAARAEVAEAHARGAVPILVGGTGLYLRTLLDGIAPVPEINPAIREEVRQMPLEDARAALLQADPERAAQLNKSDSTRIRRALEVVRSTGRALGEWQAAKSGGIGEAVELHAAILLPEREALYRRCDERFARMLERGAVDEVCAVLARGLPPRMPVMRAIGVPEIADYLAGNATLAETAARGAQATRNYAKRQFTWFRHQPPAQWQRTEDYDATSVFVSLFQD